MRLPEPLLASAFAAACGAERVGPDQHLHGVNEVHHAGPGDLTFVDHAKYYRATLEGAASVVLIDALPAGYAAYTAAAEGRPAKTLLVHPRPFAAYDALVREHRPPYALTERISRSASVHASAIVEPGAVIGPRVVVAAHARIEAGAVVYGPARIGERCRVGANCVLGDRAFYFRAAAEDPERGRRRWTTGGDLVLEDDVELGPGCVVARGVSATTRLGRGTKVDAGCVIAHDVTVGRDCLLAAQVGIAGNAVIGDGCVLYGQAGVAHNVRIGAGAVVSAKSGVSKDLPGGQTYFGAPALPLRAWMRREAAVRRLGGA